MRICFPHNTEQASLLRGEGVNFTTSEKKRVSSLPGSDSSSWCALPSFLQHTEGLHQDLGECDSLAFLHSDALGPHSSKCFTQHPCHCGPLDQGQCTMQIFQDTVPPNVTDLAPPHHSLIGQDNPACWIRLLNMRLLQHWHQT